MFVTQECITKIMFIVQVAFFLCDVIRSYEDLLTPYCAFHRLEEKRKETNDQRIKGRTMAQWIKLH